MQPSEASAWLRRIATYVDSEKAPSFSIVRSALATVLVATDRTIGLAIRDAVFNETVALMPGTFEDMYDTNIEGKGFRGGRVSLGMQPSVWKEKGIIGGILVSVDYGGQFKSEAPEQAPPDFKHSKGGALLTLGVDAKYYNKQAEGGLNSPVSLGDVDVLVDAQENVISVEIVNPSIYKSKLQSIIDSIAASPPAVAQGSGWKKRNSPSSVNTPVALLKQLLKNQRTDVKRSEISALAQVMSASQGTPVGMATTSIEDFFKRRGWAIDPNG